MKLNKFLFKPYNWQSVILRILIHICRITRSYNPILPILILPPHRFYVDSLSKQPWVWLIITMIMVLCNHHHHHHHHTHCIPPIEILCSGTGEGRSVATHSHKEGYDKKSPSSWLIYRMISPCSEEELVKLKLPTCVLLYKLVP